MAKTISEIYQIVGQVIIDAWVYQLQNFKKYPIDYDSKLLKSFAFKVSFRERDLKTGQFKPLTLELSAADYADFVDRGRKAFTKKVPITALISFIKKRNLQQKFRSSKGRFKSINQIAFMIQNSIYKIGISGRNFIFAGLEAGEKELNLHLDRDLLDILTSDIIKFYNG